MNTYTPLKKIQAEVSDLIKEANSSDEVFSYLDDCFERYPLPICFDEDKERKEMYRRTLKLRAISKRYFSIKSKD